MKLTRARSGAHRVKGIKPCLAVGGLVVECMRFKMAFCPWVYPLHPQSFTWAFGAGGPAARSAPLDLEKLMVGSQPLPGLILRLVRPVALPNQNKDR